MSFLIDNKIIENALLNWDFTLVKVLKHEESKSNVMYSCDYSKYLADTGALDELLIFINELKANKVSNNLLFSNSQFKICLHLLSIDGRLTSGYDFFSKVYCLSKYEKIVELKSLLLSDEWGKNVKVDINAEQNMVLNFALNKILSSNIANVSLLTRYIDHLFIAKNMNAIRKKSIIYSIINYCGLDNSISSEFFKLKEQYYNHIQKLLAMIHSFSPESGANLMMGRLYSLIQSNNNLSIERNNNPRVAICISGMSRADISGLRSIFEKLAIPLNADVFMHTWDVQQDWIGGARANDRFWFRTFNIDESKIPKNLLNLTYLKEHFPKISESLLTVSYSKLDKDVITSSFKLTSLLIENQDEFLERYSIGDNYKSRETLNQIKMFYGMNRVFSLLEEYERENGIRYDYVIKLRPDLIIKSGLDFSKLLELKPSDLAVPTGFYGIQDMVFYAHRDIYSQIVGIFNYMIDAKKLSPLLAFPKYDAHALFFGWLLHKDIKPVLCGIKYNVEEGIKNLKIPNLSLALEKDIHVKSKFKYPEESKWLESFLRDKAK